MSNIQQLFKEWKGLQPLSPENQKRLSDKFRLEFNYNSNHLEGNMLTYGQTQLLLVFGKTEGLAKMRDYEEMKAHNVGFLWIEDRAKETNYQLTERDIRDLNRLILVEDHRKYNPKNESWFTIHVGTYKTRPNSVITATGERFDYASPEEAPAMMHDFVSWLNDEIYNGKMSPLELASLAHYRYIRIHPFEDGNGRIARLLVTYILERSGYPTIIIKNEDKSQYLDVLNLSDINVGLIPSDGANASLASIKPFVDYMEKRLEWSLEVSIKAAQGESIEENEDFAKEITLLEREAKRKEENIEYGKNEHWNIYNIIELPLVRRIQDDLFPAYSIFFLHMGVKLLFWKGETSNPEYLELVSSGNFKEQVFNASVIGFECTLNKPRTKYDLVIPPIKIEFKIEFANNYYTINFLKDKQFRYGTYPTEEEMNGIISKYKVDVLEIIKHTIGK